MARFEQKFVYDKKNSNIEISRYLTLWRQFSCVSLEQYMLLEIISECTNHS